MTTSELETKTKPKARATARTGEARQKTMRGHGTEVEGTGTAGWPPGLKGLCTPP